MDSSFRSKRMVSSDEKRTVTRQGNPLLINTVIKCVFEYLPLEDLKQCRVVCQEWNSVSIQMLNKQSEIKLDSKERMANFLEFYKVCDIQPFPFTTFHFKLCQSKWNAEELKQLQLEDVFSTLRENIITLTLEASGVRDGLNLPALIEIATNLNRLTLSSLNSTIELNVLAKVKYLSLSYCHVSLDSFQNRIAPLSIYLKYVSFERNKTKLPEILLNDYIDFSGCSEINISPYFNCEITFDMSRDIVSARKVDFANMWVINWEALSAKVDKRLLPFEKHTGVGIKQLIFSRSDLNLSLLPKSLQKLKLDANTYDTINCLPIDLPNLECLFFRPDLDDTTTTMMSPTAYDMGIITSMFRLCPKLVDMELNGWCSKDCRCDINVDLLPVTLKRIKLSWNKNINLVGDTVIHVDILILDTGNFADAQKFMTKIKPKIVAVHLQGGRLESPAAADDIVSFIEESQKFEKIVIKVPYGGECLLLRYYWRTISRYVEKVDNDDKKSNCYAFTNQIGKRLTTEEVKLYWF